MVGPSRTCCVSEYCTGVLHNQHPRRIHSRRSISISFTKSVEEPVVWTESGKNQAVACCSTQFYEQLFRWAYTYCTANFPLDCLDLNGLQPSMRYVATREWKRVIAN